MRIGMMADTYKPHISGVTQYISLNKQWLEALGHEVFVFTFGEIGYDDEPRVIRTAGLPLVDTGFFLSLGYTPEARDLLQTMDIVHVHHPFISGQLALRYCKPAGIPILFTNHTRYDLYMQAYVPVLGDSLGMSLLQAYLPSFCRQVDLVVSPSEGMQKILEKLGVDVPIKVIPNGVDIECFLHPGQLLTRKSLGFSEDDFLVVYLGRIAVEKNLQLLLRCFAGAMHSYPQIALSIIGDGPERSALENEARALGISSKVKFTGMVPYDQVPGYLHAADVFFTPSVTEVHPLSVIEAMAAGLPILGVQSPGVGDTVEHEITGLLVPRAEEAYLTAALCRLISEPDVRRQMSQAASQSARKFNIDRTVQLIIEEYNRLACRRIAAPAVWI